MFFAEAIKKYSDNVLAVEADGTSIKYAKLDLIKEEIGQVAREKCESGKPLVFSFCKNTIGSLTGYISFLENGIVPLMLKADIEKELLEHLLEVYKPDFLYKPSDMCENENVVYENFGYKLVKTEYNDSKKIYEELALLLTTSGSTGSPKLVRQSYNNIKSNAESIIEYLKIDENERPITTLPMNYTYGLSIINSHVMSGATILLTNSTLMDKAFWEFIKAKQATSFGGVPYTYEILKKLRFFRMDLPFLKTMTQAGGKLSPELHKEFAEYARANGKEFIVMYGQTEATARMAYLPFSNTLEKCGSMGIAIPGGRLYIIDDSGNEIESPDTVGELVYEGENVTLGYASSAADLEMGDLRYGILRTGDMAKKDEDGYFYIVGRKKRFLKIYGNRVNLDETERIIRKHFENIECVCGGEDDKLSVYINSPDEELAVSVKKYIAEKTGLNAAAFKVRYVEQIPKNEAGKILYGKLEEMCR